LRSILRALRTRGPVAATTRGCRTVYRIP